MSHEVVFLPTAENDLDELFDLIADQSSAIVAQRYVGRLEAFCMGLADFPSRGVPRDDLVPGLRTMSFERRALIAYKIDSARITIVRVFSAGRDYERDMAE